jgi:ankyrin repeat protein
MVKVSKTERAQAINAAASKGHLDVVQFLLAVQVDRGAGAEVAEGGNESSNGIIVASKRRLLSKGLANAATNGHRAVVGRLVGSRFTVQSFRHCFVIAELVDSGAVSLSSDPEDYGDVPPLHCAAGNGDVAVTKLLS